MSRINGEKARAAIARKRRTAQRLKDRTNKAALVAAAATPKPASKPAPKPRAKKAAAAE
jgi:hypothetical protein